MEKLFEIIYEDEAVLVVNKPAGLACHPTKAGAYSSLIGRVRLYLGGNAQPQLVNRLDRETSGVTMIAKEPVAARELRRLWENRQVRKIYLAIVHGRVAQAHGVIEAALGKDDQSRVAIKDCVRSDGTEARTEFWAEEVFAKCPGPNPYSCPTRNQFPRPTDPVVGGSPRPLAKPQAFSLLRVVPHTGRKHQIRIHLSHEGHPVVGDKLYGVDEDMYLALVEDRLATAQWDALLLPYQALHASELQFTWHNQERLFRADPEQWFKQFLRTT